jgi:hypothetical protein
MSTSNDALSKINDAPQLLVATITTNTTTAGLSHDLSNCADQVVAVALTVSAYSGAGSVKLLLEESDDNLTFTAIPNEKLRLKDATGAYLEPADKADAAKLSANGVSKLGFLKSKQYFKASAVSTGITGSATVSVIAQYEKAVQI